MKSITRIAAVAAFALASIASAQDGLIAVKSPMKTKATMDKFEAIVKEKGMNVFARVDHAAGAMKVNKTLRPTEVLIFGNPQGGTPFMECAQSVGIDLPLKALVWEDGIGGLEWTSSRRVFFWHVQRANEIVGIDLPLKALVWEDKDGQTWIGYNDPKYLAARHKTECAGVVENMGKAMNSFVQAAVTQ
jgi:uncharacterized protein (DUF302 family)